MRTNDENGRVCEICGTPLTGRQTNHCGDPCRKEAAKRRNRLNYKPAFRNKPPGNFEPMKRDRLETKVHEGLKQNMLYADIQRMQYGYPPKRRETE